MWSMSLGVIMYSAIAEEMANFLDYKVYKWLFHTNSALILTFSSVNKVWWSTILDQKKTTQNMKFTSNNFKCSVWQ